MARPLAERQIVPMVNFPDVDDEAIAVYGSASPIASSAERRLSRDLSLERHCLATVILRREAHPFG